MPNVKDEEVRIGDFSKPIVPPKEPTVKKAEGNEVARLESAETRLEKEAEKTEKELGPLERYERALKRIEVSKEEAATIVDTILVNGFWTKEIPLTSKRKVVFRTRMYQDVKRFNNYIEAVQPKNPSNYNELLYKFTLAASLMQYDRYVFDHPSPSEPSEKIEDAFQKRLKFVEGLGDPAVRLCYNKLAKFDDIVSTVMEEGAAENF